MGGAAEGPLILENPSARVVIDVAHGAEIVSFTVGDGELELVAPGPQGPRQASGDPDLAFIDGYHGGWQEVFPNGGAPSTLNGTRFGQHDEVWRLPWTVEAHDAASATLTVQTRLVPFRLRKEVRLAPGSARLEVGTRATNIGPDRERVMWGQHLAYGPPFLLPGTRLELPLGVPVVPHPVATNPPRRMVDPGPGAWPVVRTPEGGEIDLRELPAWGGPSDILYAGPFADPAWYELRRPDGWVVRVDWGAATLPYCWLWYELGATLGAPWYGTLRAIGVEPNSSWPTDGLAEAVANGTARTIAGGQTMTSWHTVEASR